MNLPNASSSLSHLGALAAFGSSFTWAYGTSAYTRYAKRFEASDVNLARSLIVLPLFLGLALWLSPWSDFSSVTASMVGWLILSTLCSYALGDALFYKAATRIGTPVALAIASSYPLLSYLSAIVFLGEKLTPWRFLGVSACVAGIAWLIIKGPQESRKQAQSETQNRRAYLLGTLLALGAAVLWAGNTYTLRMGSGSLSLFVANSVRFSCAIAILSVSHFYQRLMGTARGPSLVSSPREMLGFMRYAVIESFIGGSLFVYGISHAPLSIAAALSSLAPLISLMMSYLNRTERIDASRAFGVVMTVVGVILLVTM